MPTQAKKDGNARHIAKLDVIKIQPYKEEGATIRAAAANAGKSVQGYILEAIREKMERERTATVPTSPQTATAPQATEGTGGVVSVSTPPVQSENGISGSPSLTPPDSNTGASTTQGAFDHESGDKSRPYLPVPPYEDDSTPVLEAKLVAILSKKGIAVPTVAEFEALPPERQQTERARLLEARECARQVLEKYEASLRQW